MKNFIIFACKSVYLPHCDEHFCY